MTCGRSERSDPEITKLVAANGVRSDTHARPGAVTFDEQRHFLSATRHDLEAQGLPRIHTAPVDGQDPISDLQARRGRRAVLGHDADDRGRCLVQGHIRALRQHPGQDHPGQHDVHDRSGDVDLEPYPFALREKLVWFPRPVFFNRLAGKLYVTTEGKDTDAVLGAAPFELDDLRSEAQRKRDHPHAVPAGDQEVTELVHEHEHAQHEQKRKSGNHGTSVPYDDGSVPMAEAENVRAHASAARTSASEAGAPRP